MGSFMTWRLMDRMVSCMDCLLVMPFSPYVHLFVIRANQEGAVGLSGLWYDLTSPGKDRFLSPGRPLGDRHSTAGS
jgi:hypothetical protein